MTTYEQWREFLVVVAEGAAAELAGYEDAHAIDKPGKYTRNQARYEQGFFEGKAKLAKEELPV